MKVLSMIACLFFTSASYGVTTTQTTNGGRAKTKNGMGVAQGPGGTTCVKGKYEHGCKK